MKLKSNFKRIAVLGLTTIMTMSCVASTALSFADTSTDKVVSLGETSQILDFTDLTGKLDLSSVTISNLSSSVLQDDGSSSVSTKNTVYTFIVTLEGDSIMEQKDENETVATYLSTRTGKKALRALNNSQKSFLNQLDKAGIDYTYVNSYSTITNSIALKLNSSDVAAVRAMSNVKSVVFSSTYAYPETTSETSSANATYNLNEVYETGIYDSSKYTNADVENTVNGIKVDGSGITVAILDTGLDYTHTAFSHMPDEGTLGLSLSDVESKMSATTFEATKLSEASGKSLSASDVYLNAKIPFAYDYADNDTDVYPSYSQHGTHVAGIVAGQDETYTDKDGNTATDSSGNSLTFNGVAPNAQLVICKVFTDDFDSKDLGGATTEDILAALEDCVNLNVDIINMSLGTSAGFSSITIEGDSEGQWMNEVYGSIQDAGINLICAASNDYSSGFGSVFGTNLASNPDSGTIGSPSTFTGAMSVASINGQKARYMTVETKSGTTEAIYYLDSNGANSVSFDFNELMLGSETTKTFKYVVIPGVGQASDYTTAVKNQLADKSDGIVIAVIRRGTTTFQDKVEIAMRMGADAVIVYNNVAGTIRMSLGDIDDPIPAVSVTMDAGKILTAAATNRVGYITLNQNNQAGPFMNDYSSWGTTPDLKLKPDITAHGGEITSTVSGGYDEMSGTSMASPNMAGFMALLRSYLKTSSKFSSLSAKQLTTLSNQLVMSTATIVYDQEGLPYSPRKQGSGLATLDNVFNTSAYLYTVDGAEDGRPKVELGDDKDKNGVYPVTFNVTNFGTSTLSFTAKSMFFTESLSSDGLSVAEKAYMLGDIPAKWVVNGTAISEGDTIDVAAGQSAEITVTLTLSDAEKQYLDQSFVNGMFVEGYIQLVSNTEGQCDLNLPYMGFYGDWEAAPMLDYDCYEISEFLQDTSLTDATRPQAQVWATQAYASYYNSKYTVPLGSFVYVQDESADQIYTDKEHAAISCYNDYYGEDSNSNYMTTTALKAVYAGLLRNAELVTYDLYNSETGELIKSDEVYRLNKAYAGGGSATPSQVLLELTPEDLGLEANGKYQMEFHFYRLASDKDDPSKTTDDNTFSMVFYVDYEAPVLVESRIRYYDYKQNNKDMQKVYLDLDIYDNHYPQAVILCYASEDSADSNGAISIQLATDYVTPIYNPQKNSTTTVSIEITDLISEYKGNLYVQIDDYALNHSVYQISFDNANKNVLPSSFTIADGDNITTVNGEKTLTIGVNETAKISLNNIGSANLSNFTWRSSRTNYVKVKNGEVFGVAVGSSTITVTGNGTSQKITVNVVASSTTLAAPSLSFGVIKNYNDALQKASGTVKVNAGQTINLQIESDPWYYDIDNSLIKWSSNKTDVATVDSNGVVKTLDKKGSATIRAELTDGNGKTITTASVTLNVQDPFTVSSNSLTKYHGTGGYVVIPDDENITTISSEAFKDNDNITAIVIPKTVTQISARAFINCTALKYVYFIQEEALAIADADLSLILNNAFEGCTSLEVVDLTNVKTITVDKEAFLGCTSLREIKHMEKMGTINRQAFSGCTSLESIDISGLHVAGESVFAGCTALTSVTTAYYTDLGSRMFEGCTSLNSITINTPTVGAYAFKDCVGLETINFGTADGDKLSFKIGDFAFDGCLSLSKVNFNGNTISSLGDRAFADCKSLEEFNISLVNTTIGDKVFSGTAIEFGAIYNGTTLVMAPSKIDSTFAIKAGTTKIGDYAFSSTTLDGVTTISIPSSVTTIGIGAFANSNFTSLEIPSTITTISDYASYGMENLTSIVIPASVTSIGVSAFEGCGSLTSITFEEGSSLVSIGNAAFRNDTSLESVVLPDGVKTMGDYTFYGCFNLKTVTLPSLEDLGSYTFWLCTSLESATFGKDAVTAGDYTFFPGSDNNGTFESSLKSVTLGDKTTVLGTAVFLYCSQLTTIDLNNVTVVGESAFANCERLSTVTGIEKVTYISASAFYNCAFKELNLESAEVIATYAFWTNAAKPYTKINIPKAQTIGSFAFFGGAESTVTIPASVTSIGEAAFAYSSSLTKIEVSSDNKIFFADENGVLYRTYSDFTSGTTYYQLMAYPSGRAATAVDGVRTYTIIDGTSSVAAYAFSYLTSNVLKKVVLPYSVKTIGVCAFYSSGIDTYEFQSINAPTLLSDLRDNGLTGFNSLYYTNFEDEFIIHTNLVTSTDATPASVTIMYPSNGSGYTNYVYTTYFDSKVITAELMDDTTRQVKDAIEAFASAETVASWNSLEVTESNKAMISSFADSVKSTHALYNQISGATQLQYLGDENVTKLLAIESALKSVKEKFGIAASVSSLSVSADSTYKSAYKEGETFDTTGLIVIVNYDDYSSEVADMSKLTLTSTYSGPLNVFYRYVELSGYGKTVQVSITVTAASVDDDNNSGSGEGSGNGGDVVTPPATDDNTATGGGCDGCGSSISGGWAMIGLLGIMATAFVVAKLIKRKYN
jgi:lactocepin